MKKITFFKVGAIQTETTDDKEENLKRCFKYLDKAADLGVKIACFHEYFTTECPMINESAEDVEKRAEPIPGPTINALVDKAKGYGMYIIAGSIIEESKGKLYNTSVLIDQYGKVIGKYRKTHPENHPAKHEVGRNITLGDEYPVFKTDLCKIGIMIDVDANAPEVPRILGNKGADIIFWPLNWSARWTYLIAPMAATYAVTSACYVVAVNRVGLRKKQVGPYPLLYGGGSLIADPDGYILTTRIFREGIVASEIDMENLKHIRTSFIPNTYPFWRRPQTYKEIVEL